MPAKFNITRGINRLRKLDRAFSKEIERASKLIGKGVIANSVNRYDHKGHADVLAAVRNAGFEIRTSSDGDTTIFVGDMGKLDRATAKTAVATGKTWHMWRILHEGSGPLSNTTNPRIAGKVPEASPWPFIVFIRTADIPNVAPGSYPPFIELVSLEGRPGVHIVRSSGRAGRAWFLKNMQLFIQDQKLARNEIRAAIDTAVYAAKRG